MMNNKQKICCVLMSLYLITQQVCAYLDPGTGSIIFQFLIGGLIGLSYLFKSKVLAIFENVKNRLIK